MSMPDWGIAVVPVIAVICFLIGEAVKLAPINKGESTLLSRSGGEKGLRGGGAGKPRCSGNRRVASLSSHLPDVY